MSRRYPYASSISSTERSGSSRRRHHHHPNPHHPHHQQHPQHHRRRHVQPQREAVEGASSATSATPTTPNGEAQVLFGDRFYRLTGLEPSATCQDLVFALLWFRTLRRHRRRRQNHRRHQRRENPLDDKDDDQDDQDDHTPVGELDDELQQLDQPQYQEQLASEVSRYEMVVDFHGGRVKRVRGHLPVQRLLTHLRRQASTFGLGAARAFQLRVRRRRSSAGAAAVGMTTTTMTAERSVELRVVDWRTVSHRHSRDVEPPEAAGRKETADAAGGVDTADRTLMLDWMRRLNLGAVGGSGGGSGGPQSVEVSFRQRHTCTTRRRRQRQRLALPGEEDDFDDDGDEIDGEVEGGEIEGEDEINASRCHGNNASHRSCGCRCCCCATSSTAFDHAKTTTVSGACAAAATVVKGSRNDAGGCRLRDDGSSDTGVDCLTPSDLAVTSTASCPVSAAEATAPTLYLTQCLYELSIEPCILYLFTLV